MTTKILLTGPPRCGKSTLIMKVINYCKENEITVDGFLTPEVKEGNKRIGFDIERISINERRTLARIGNYRTQYRLGKYHVFIGEFEKIISKLEKLEFKERNIVVVDEIGKMELFSQKFQKLVKILFKLDINIIATIGQSLQHPIKDYLLNLPEVLLITLNRENIQTIQQKILDIIDKIFFQ
ncbi:MAG: nucleoside-triphosphatase [Promethearchaeota archaeon]